MKQLPYFDSSRFTVHAIAAWGKQVAKSCINDASNGSQGDREKNTGGVPKDAFYVSEP
jgi:hypothetical protein